MVRIISENERKRMLIDEIKEQFDGKWIFAVNTETNPFSGIPIIIADKPYEDREQGIYDQYRNQAIYGTPGHVSFLSNPRLFGFEIF